MFISLAKTTTTINYYIIQFCSIDDRTELRQRLHCKPFKWYLANVYPQLQVPEMLTVGTLRQGIHCLDTLGHLVDGNVGVYQCHETGGNQEWTITKKGQIKHHDLCLTLVSYAKGSIVIMRMCDDSENQRWELREGGLLKHIKSNICLDTRFVAERGITAELCNSGLDSQYWRFVNKRS